MSSPFYTRIIKEKEKNIKNIALKNAANEIAISSKTKPVEKGCANLDYNKPEYRCAYLYKFANLHTGMVTKYFQKILKKKEVKRILYSKKNIKICCLGGGPGTDAVGIFKALAYYPCFHKKITKVSVMDVCTGWETSYDTIMLNLINGKEKVVPDTFVDKTQFEKEFVGVDLLGPLPNDVKKVISNADIICMVKFVSAVLPKEGSLYALKVLGDLFKKKAIVLFIDNCKGDSFESIDCISRQNDLEIVLGPLKDEKYIRPSKSNEAVYGCKPHTCNRVSVIGWIKSSGTNYANDITSSTSTSLIEDDWESVSESRDSVTLLSQCSSEDYYKETNATVCVCDKYTQTEQAHSCIPSENIKAHEDATSSEIKELSTLVTALADLLTLMENFTPERNVQKSCCCCLYAH